MLRGTGTQTRAEPLAVLGGSPGRGSRDRSSCKAKAGAEPGVGVTLPSGQACAPAEVWYHLCFQNCWSLPEPLSLPGLSHALDPVEVAEEDLWEGGSVCVGGSGRCFAVTAALEAAMGGGVAGREVLPHQSRG